MAALLVFLLHFAFHTAVAQPRQLNISLGSSLSPTGNSSWLSRSGLYAFGFYQQGNGYAVGVFMAGVPEKTAVWTANRDNPIVPSNSTLSLTIDGRLVLQEVQQQDITVVNPSESIAAASMLDSGNFVLYNSSQQIAWQSFDNPTNTILPGQHLTNGRELISSSSETDDSKGIFRLKMQADGNLVQYPVGTPDTAPYSYWSSGTYGLGSKLSLNLDNDGHLYLFNSSNIIHHITSGGFPTRRTTYFAKVDVDGIFRLYSLAIDQGNRSVRWQSSNNKCDPKGLCGFNSFCDSMGTEADCKCPPGFDFVVPGNWSLGCQRNFTAESCKNMKGNVKYIISQVNVLWEDNPYYELKTITPAGCQKACLEDCNCEVAFFKDGNCIKQRLPLRFGSKTSDSSFSLIKVGAPASSDTPSFLPKTGKKQPLVDILIISISLLVFSVCILVISGVLMQRSRVWRYNRITEKRNAELIENIAPQAFTYAELQQATNDFGQELGKGAFGTVYKGVLPEGLKAVAVKRLDKLLAEGESEFQNEIRVIGKTHHRNLVRLLGYCLERCQRLLVYEYMSNGSLANVLFDCDNQPSWEERVEIALDVARGILYLHEECETQIIHCDIKPQNILMDEHWCAKISDFGLAKRLKRDQTRTYTGIKGTKGYVAPEWHRKMPITVKADVYSFGIVLLEIVCCRKGVDWSLPEDEAILDEWAYTCFEAGRLQNLVRDEGVDRKKLERMIKIAIWCIQDEPSLRPSMKKVLLMLEGTVDIPLPPSPTSFLSAM